MLQIKKVKNVDDYIDQQWTSLPLWNHELALYHPYPYYYPDLVKHMPLDYLDALPALKTNFLNVKVYPAKELNYCMFFELPLRYYNYTGTSFDIKSIEKLYSSKERRYLNHLRFSIREMRDKKLLENYQHIVHAIPTPFDAAVLENFAAYGHDYYSQVNSEWVFFWLPGGDIAIYF